MSRQLRRVPLDFTWPLNKPWEGFVNPHYGDKRDCPFCKGSGMSPYCRLWKDKFYGYAPFDPAEKGSEPFAHDDPRILKHIAATAARLPGWYDTGGELPVLREARRMTAVYNAGWAYHLDDKDVQDLVDEGRLNDLTGVRWNCESKAWEKPAGYRIPTPREVGYWHQEGMGHDCINLWILLKSQCARAGEVHNCAHCDGDGDIWLTPEAKARMEEWEDYEPPTGEGWQMWEGVTEGSPVAPVFATPEELARWLTANHECLSVATYEGWMQMILGDGWAPSMIGSRVYPGDLTAYIVSGVDAAKEQE